MRQEKILAMPASREMDALIAENFFGWKWFFAEGMKYFRPSKRFSYGAIGDGKTTEYMSCLPSYSVDISAAFEVAEILADKWDFAIVNNQHFRKHPELHYGFRLQALDEDVHVKTIFTLGKTAPIAICRAALLLAFRPAAAGSNPTLS